MKISINLYLIFALSLCAFSIQAQTWDVSGASLTPIGSGNSLFLGAGAGVNDDLSNNGNIFMGTDAGGSNTTGALNAAIGRNALNGNTSGLSNFALGANSLQFSNSNFNVAIGVNSMREQTTGGSNVGIGSGANLNNTGGSNNVMIGVNAGRGTAAHSKSGNVFIGYQAGFNETGSDKLYIDNSNTSDPLLFGDFSTDQVGIATSQVADGYALSVGGKGIFTEVRVLEIANWPDYVFQPEYNLRTLEEVNNFIKTNGHLPNIPSAKEVEANGVALGNMDKNLLEKIEELTLYMIDMNEQVKELKAENDKLKKEINTLKK